MDQVTFNNDLEDAIYWKFSVSGEFTTKSIYNSLIDGGKIIWEHERIWKYKVPQTVQIFCCLLLKNRILTKANLKARGMNCETHCNMCNNCPVESAAHLLSWH